MSENKKLVLENNMLEELCAEAYSALILAEKIIKLQNSNSCLPEVETAIKNIDLYWERNLG